MINPLPRTAEQMTLRTGGVLTALLCLLLAAPGAWAASENADDVSVDVGNLLIPALLLLMLMAVAYASIVQIQPYEAGVLMVLGKLSSGRPLFEPGWNFVYPFVSMVWKVDLRIFPLDIARFEATTLDGCPTLVKEEAYAQVKDPVKAMIEVPDYQLVSKHMARALLEKSIQKIPLTSLQSNRDWLNEQFRKDINEETTAWGVEIMKFELREVEPASGWKPDPEAQLERLVHMREEGHLSDKEFEQAKRKLLE